MSESPLHNSDKARVEPSQGTEQGLAAASQSGRSGQQDPIHLLPGNQVFGGFSLVDLMSRNPNGEVWRATRPDQMAVALHCIDSWRSGSRAELRSLSHALPVRHPHLLTLFGPWQSDGWIGIGTDLADGTLLDRLQAAKSAGCVGIEVAELLDLMEQAARGIDYLTEPRHALAGQTPTPLIHCNIQPTNMLLFGSVLRIGSFESMQRFGPDQEARLQPFDPEQPAVTSVYSAPELYQGLFSLRSDQYSLAATYCHLRGGQIPLIPTNRLTSVDLTMLPSSERPLVDRALSLDPDRRWPTCVEFVAALHAVARPVIAIPTRATLSRPDLLKFDPVAATRESVLNEIDHDYIDEATLEAIPSIRLNLAPVGVATPIVVPLPVAGPGAAEPIITPVVPLPPMLAATGNTGLVTVSPEVPDIAPPRRFRKRSRWLLPAGGLAAGIVGLVVWFSMNGTVPGLLGNRDNEGSIGPVVAKTLLSRTPASVQAGSEPVLAQRSTGDQFGPIETQMISSPTNPPEISPDAPLARVELPRATRSFARPPMMAPNPVLSRNHAVTSVPPVERVEATKSIGPVPSVVTGPFLKPTERTILPGSSVPVVSAKATAPVRSPSEASPTPEGVPPPLVVASAPVQAPIRVEPTTLVTMLPRPPAPAPVSAPGPDVVARPAPSPSTLPVPPVVAVSASRPMPARVEPSTPSIAATPAPTPAQVAIASVPRPISKPPEPIASLASLPSVASPGPSVVVPPISAPSLAPELPRPPIVVASPPGPSGPEVAAALRSWAGETQGRLTARVTKVMTAGRIVGRAVADLAAPKPTPIGPTDGEILAAIHVWGASRVEQLEAQIRATWNAGATWLRAHPLSPPTLPVVASSPALITPQTVTIVVRMPSARAELVVRGEVGRGNPDEWYGPSRVIHSPPLSVAQDYLVGAFWTDATGRPATRSQLLRVEPGHRYEVDLRTEKTTAAEVPRSVGP